MLATEKELGDLLREVGAWQTGHFLLSSGLHSNEYVQCQRVLQYPRYGRILGEAMVKRLRAAGIDFQTVIGPALGAVHWELLVAAAIDSLLEDPVKAVFAERQSSGDEFQVRRGIELRKGEQVLVVEDVTTTGGSAAKVIELVRQLGATPVAVGAIVDRSGGKVSFGLPFFSLIKLSLETYAVQDCPMCREQVPITKPGSSTKTRA